MNLRKLFPWISASLLVVVIVIALWPKALLVEIATVKRAPLTVTVLEEGKTRIRHRYIITPPIAGVLQRVKLRAGAPIVKGETVLATIEAKASGFLDPRAREETKARLKAAEASKMQHRALVGKAKAALDLANKDFVRADALRKEDIVSVDDWENAEAEVRLRTQELNAAEFALRVSEFEIEQAEAALSEAQYGNESKPFYILSPIDGYVLNIFEENEKIVQPGTPIMEIGNLLDLEAEIELLSSDAVAVSPGADVIIEKWGGNSPLRGKVAVVEPAGFTKISALGVEEQRVKVRVDFVDPLPSDKILGDRYRVEGNIVTWESDDVLQVPTGALFRRGNEWRVFVVERGRAYAKPVEIGHSNGLVAEVISGLKEGDKVVIYPPDTLEEGARI